MYGMNNIKFIYRIAFDLTPSIHLEICDPQALNRQCSHGGVCLLSVVSRMKYDWITHLPVTGNPHPHPGYCDSLSRAPRKVLSPFEFPYRPFAR
jgi:hypothetical protein